MRRGNDKRMSADAQEPQTKRASGEREAEILDVLLHSGGPLTPGDVAGRLEGEPTYSTVVTVLSRMFDKGLLTRDKQGRAYAYAPVADAHGLTARRMRQVLESDTDREAVLSRFVGELSDQDEQLLRQLLGDQSGER